MWQLIETAPKDGTIVDLWSPKYGRVIEQWWDEDDQSWSGWSGEARFSHWMMVPEPPTAQLSLGIRLYRIESLKDLEQHSADPWDARPASALSILSDLWEEEHAVAFAHLNSRRR